MPAVFPLVFQQVAGDPPDDPWRLMPGLHRWLFKSLQAVHQPASELIHEANRKPFTLTLLRSCNGGLWTTRLSVLADGLLGFFHEGVQRATGQAVAIGGRRFMLLGLTENCLVTSYSALQQRSIQANRVRLCFHTPTAFRQKTGRCLYPEPQKVFYSLRERWNLFNEDAAIPDEFLQLVYRHVWVDGYSLRTRVISLYGQREAGFFGEVEFVIDDHQDFATADRQVLTSLIRYAPYAGIGIKTGQGMGEVELLQS